MLRLYASVPPALLLLPLAACETTTSGAPEFLSSHPADSSRVQRIAALLPTVMPLHQASLGRR